MLFCFQVFRNGEEDKDTDDIPRQAAEIIEFAKAKSDPNYKPPPSAGMQWVL